MSRQGDRVAFISFATVVVFGSATAVGIRFSNRELAPLWGAGFRFLIAAAILGAVMAVLRLPAPQGRALRGAAVFGALNFGGAFALLYYGLVRVHGGLGQTMLAVVPLATLILAVAHGQERMRPRALIGALVALAGVASLSLGPLRDGVPLVSILALVGSALCMAEAAVLVRSFPAVHPVPLNAIAMLVGGALLTAASTMLGEPMELPRATETWLALAYTVLIGSVVVFVLFIVVLAHWSASRTTYAFVLIPLLTVLLSAWIDDEPLRPELGIGGLLVVAGVYIGALRSSPAEERVVRPTTPT